MSYTLTNRLGRLLAILLVLSLAAAPGALAVEGPRAGTPVGEEVAQRGRDIAAERQAFAGYAHELAQAFLAAVTEWTSCVSEAASANEESQDGTNPLNECGPLDVTQSPGHAISIQ